MNEINPNEKIHLHDYHGDEAFSCFLLRINQYENIAVAYKDLGKIKYYPKMVDTA
jgi:hypothetical protein